MRSINNWACFTNCACALLINGHAFAKASAEISEKSSGNQKSQRDFEISYAKTARVGPLDMTPTSSLLSTTSSRFSHLQTRKVNLPVHLPCVVAQAFVGILVLHANCRKLASGCIKLNVRSKVAGPRTYGKPRRLRNLATPGNYWNSTPRNCPTRLPA